MKNKLDWEAINRAWQESGLSQEEYCAQTGISYSQFCGWRSRQIKRGKFKSLRYKIASVVKQSAKTEKPEFIPIDLKQSRPKSQAQAFMELDLPHGVVLRIPLNVS